MIISQSSKKIVGVSQRVDSIEGRDEFRDALDQRLIQWILLAGFLPVAIPNTLISADEQDALALESWLQAMQPSALLLSGGNDIGEFVTRDVTERYLLSWAESKELPVLGICRGMQMMAEYGNVNLIKKEGHVRRRHQLMITDNYKDEWPANVNSYHDLILSSCPEGFEIAATSEDGSIEAIKHIKLPWEGWMWHPEREQSFSSQDMKRLQRLFGE